MTYATQSYERRGAFSLRRFIAGLFVVMLVTGVAAGAVMISPLSNSARALTFHSAVTDRGMPATAAPGTTTTFTLRFRNTGLAAWDRDGAGKRVELGVKKDSAEFATAGMAVGWLSDSRIATTTEPLIPAGAIGSFTFTVRAPTALGLYRIPVQLVVDGTTWLDDESVFVVVASDFGFHSELVDQSRHPTLRVGETSGAITVKLRNTGTRAWVRGKPDQQVTLGLDGDQSLRTLATGWPSADRVAVQTEATVVPGEAATFAFRVRAPLTPGTYALRLRPVVDGVTWLDGDNVMSLITVTAAGQSQPQTASFSSTASVAQDKVQAGQAAAISVSFRSGSAASALLGVEIYAPGGASLAYQKWFDEQSFAAGEQRTFPVTWQVPAGAVVGTYTVSLRAFAPGWKTLYSSKDNATTLSITAPVQAAQPTPAPGGNAPTAAPPSGGQSGPTPTPSPSAVPTFTSSASVTPASVTLGSSINVSASFTSATATSALVSVSIYPPGGAIAVKQQSFDNQSFAAGQRRDYAMSWSVPTNGATGAYRVSLGVFAPGYGTQYSWNDAAATFVATAIPASPTPTPAATPTPTPTAAPTPTPTPTTPPTPTPAVTPSAPPSVSYALQLTSSPDGSGPSALAGRTVTGGIYVFVLPSTGVTQVRFNVDGVLSRTENLAPFTLAGDVNGIANPFDTTTLSNGAHTITASVDRTGGTDLLVAAVTVANVLIPLPTLPPLPTLLPPPPPPSSSGCPSPAYTRLVNVSTPSQLSSAVAGALPGDKIVMAPGIYNMTGAVNISRAGTSAQPIQLVGPRTAILDFGSITNYSFIHLTTNWWIISGFTHRNSVNGPLLTNANNNVLCDLLVEHMGKEGVAIKGTSSYNTLQDSVIRDTGETFFYWAESVYIGSGQTSREAANYNKVVGNRFGPNSRSDHVDVKGGTTGNRIEGNVSDATGWRYTNGSDSGGQVTSAVFSNQGLNTTFVGNTVNNLNSPSAYAYQNWQGTGTQYHGNRASGSFQYGFATSGGSGNVIGCDNTVIGGLFANVPCL